MLIKMMVDIRGLEGVECVNRDWFGRHCTLHVKKIAEPERLWLIR